jgi:hypothetical protein
MDVEWFHVIFGSHGEWRKGAYKTTMPQAHKRYDLLHYRCCLDGQGVLDSSGLMNVGTNGGE